MTWYHNNGQDPLLTDTGLEERGCYMSHIHELIPVADIEATAVVLAYEIAASYSIQLSAHKVEVY